jgi:hypothetical protein
MSLDSWWDDDYDAQLESPRNQDSTSDSAAIIAHPHVPCVGVHSDGQSMSWQARIEASAMGSWWADGWGRHKEDFDKGIQLSPRARLLSNFDALDVQNGEMIVTAQEKLKRSSEHKEKDEGSKFQLSNPFLRVLLGDDASAVVLTAEEMLMRLKAKKVKQHCALQEWTEIRRPGGPHPQGLDREEELSFASCASVVLDLRGIEGTISDTSFTEARIRIGLLLYRLAENSSANSALLIMHGLVPMSSPPIYAVDLEFMQRRVSVCIWV